MTGKTGHWTGGAYHAAHCGSSLSLHHSFVLWLARGGRRSAHQRRGRHDGQGRAWRRRDRRQDPALAGAYDLTTNGLLRLKADGVSEAVIKAMIEASAGGEAPGPKPAQGGAVPTDAARSEEAAIALYKQGRSAEAAAAFDRLIAEKPNDDGLRVWKALTLLEQAREIKDANAIGVQAAGHERLCDPAAARAETGDQRGLEFRDGQGLLVERPAHLGESGRGERPPPAANYPEAQLLLGDLAYDSEVSSLAQPPGSPARESALRWAGASCLGRNSTRC